MGLISEDSEEKELYLVPESETRNCIISFYNRSLIKFDFVICLLILFECWYVPYKSVFEEEQGFVTRVLHSIVIFGYFCDILIGFRRSYICEMTGEEI